MHRKSSPQQIKETSRPQDPSADVMYMHASIASATSSHRQVFASTTTKNPK